MKIYLRTTSITYVVRFLCGRMGGNEERITSSQSVKWDYHQVLCICI